MTLGEALAWARERVDRLDARLLLEHAASCTHADLLARPETPLAAPAYACFAAWVARRAGGEPLAYLTGEAEFRGRVFQVTPDVLVPRGDTEVLVDQALRRLAAWVAGKHADAGRETVPGGDAVQCGAPEAGTAPAAPRVLDLGTGSGIVAISLALECPAARLTAVDISAGALAVARNNGGRLGAVVDWRQGDWYAPLGNARFDLIVANPPYIAEGDPHLAGDGLPFEPRQALTDGGDGLSCIRAIVAGAAAHLAPGGCLLFEHGHDQGHDSRNLLLGAGFKAVATFPDLAGLDRVSGGYL